MLQRDAIDATPPEIGLHESIYARKNALAEAGPDELSRAKHEGDIALDVSL